MKNHLLTIALCGLFVSYGFAQTSVLPLKAELASSEGLVYKLPLTTLVIKAEATQTVQKPGPFFKYAERFLGTTNVVTEEKTEWPDYTQNPPQIKGEETQVLILQAIFAL